MIVATHTFKPSIGSRFVKRSVVPNRLQHRFFTEDTATSEEKPTEFDEYEEKLSELMEQVEEYKHQVDECKMKYLRSLSDLDNLRKRHEIQLASAKKFGVQSFAKEMTAIYENIERAHSNIPDEANDHDEAALKQLVVNIREGVDVTKSGMKTALKKQGVEKIPTDIKFDPQFHEAMFEAPHPELEDGEISNVMQEGWFLHERVIVPAKVGVVKNPKQENLE